MLRNCYIRSHCSNFLYVKNDVHLPRKSKIALKFNC